MILNSFQFWNWYRTQTNSGIVSIFAFHVWLFQYHSPLNLLKQIFFYNQVWESYPPMCHAMAMPSIAASRFAVIYPRPLCAGDCLFCYLYANFEYKGLIKPYTNTLQVWKLRSHKCGLIQGSSKEERAFFSCVLILLTKRPLISFKRGSTSQSLNCCNIILFIISNGHLLPSVWLLHVPKRKAILRQIMNSSPFSVFIWWIQVNPETKKGRITESESNIFFSFMYIF